MEPQFACLIFLFDIYSPGKTVFTSDDALKLEWVPDWVAIVGSGYIGLEFSDVYTALGSEASAAGLNSLQILSYVTLSFFSHSGYFY